MIRPLAASLLFAFGLDAWGASCLEDRDFLRNLPTVIGREDQTGKLPFALHCDTVFVRRGVTTVVHPGTMLYFSKPSINSVIKVEGTLIIKGSRNSYVTLSGSLDSTRNGLEPGQKQWAGIEVAEGGRLEMEYAGFMRAPTPVTAFSTQVKIKNCWFKGSSGMFLPDGTLYAMESTWHAINDMDLSQGATDRKADSRPPEALSEGEKAALLRKDREGGYWTWRKVGIGAAALAVAGAGVVFLLPEKESSPPPSGNDKPKGTGIPVLLPPPGP